MTNIISFPIAPGLQGKGAVVARVTVERVGSVPLSPPRELVVVARPTGEDYIFHVFEPGQYQPGDADDDGA